MIQPVAVPADASAPSRLAGGALWLMAAFGFVQHNFFILFNALIGVVFLRRAQRELFGR